MHICCKVGEICESGRFISPTWETSSKREFGPIRGSGRVIRYALNLLFNQMLTNRQINRLCYQGSPQLYEGE